jgi:hypothetical protein
MNDRLWIQQTQQFWKIVLFLALIMIDLVVFAVFVWSVNFPSDQATYTSYRDQVVLSLVFVGVGSLAFGFLSVLIRCPAYKRSVGWHVLSTANANNWFATLMRLDHCPFCS